MARTIRFGWTEKSFGSGERGAASAKPRAVFTRRMADGLGVPEHRFVWMDQVHSGRIREIKNPPTGQILSATDGCVTTSTHLALCVRSADCLPLLLYDPRGHAVAAIHAGWRGLLAGIVDGGVAAICRAARCRMREVRAVFGPAIQTSCYEVGEDIRDLFVKKYGPWAGEFFKQEGKWKMSLMDLAVNRLKRAGVPIRHIQVCRLCTACHPSRYYSFRSRGESGRFVSYIFIDPAARLRPGTAPPGRGPACRSILRSI